MNKNNFEKLVKEKYDSLSPGKKKVAEYIQKNLYTVSYCTVGEVQKATGVSETTVIRLAYSLGYDGFSDMQNDIRNFLFDKNDTESFKSDSPTHGYLSNIINKDLELINNNLKDLNLKEYDFIIEKIIESNKIFIVGNNTSYPSAIWLYQTLRLIKDNVFLANSFDEYDQLLKVDSDSIVIGISFPRYNKQTYKFVKRAKEQGGYILAITDSKLSPIGRNSDSILLTNTNRDESGYNSIAPVLSLLNLIIAGIRSKEISELKYKLQYIEQYFEEDDTVFE